MTRKPPRPSATTAAIPRDRDAYMAAARSNNRAFKLNTDIASLDYNREIYKELAGISPEQHNDRFAHWWQWANQNGLNVPEYLFPQIIVPTTIEPFSFEQKFAQRRMTAPAESTLKDLAPWAYQVEFGERTTTLGHRADAEWKYHRYRASLLVQTAARIAGADIGHLSVLDLASHCGVFSLEFAELGFGDVIGIDLRERNVAQAQFLAEQFDVRNVKFSQCNAWDAEATVGARDVVFCGGLMYHVTYPMKLLSTLYNLTNDFLVLDTLTHKNPFSGFYLVCRKDVNYSAEGEFHYELHPTYRAVCDGLLAVGFTDIWELIGTDGNHVPSYDTVNVRSFVAAKNKNSRLHDFVASIQNP